MPRRKTPDEWLQMFTLPNILIEEPIEADGVAMVSVHDERAQTLARRHRRFSMYLNRFTSEFGQQVAPSLILVRADKFDQYRTVEALAGFRDAVAIATIPYSSAHVLRYENNHNIKYANRFSFYPWVVDNKFEGLIMQSMAQTGWHEEGTCDAVCKLLESIKWNLSDNSNPIYEPHKYKAGQPKRALPIWLYGAMNHARNDFIHGNTIDPMRLIVAPGKRPLHLYTAPLYRMALTAFLDLKLLRW